MLFDLQLSKRKHCFHFYACAEQTNVELVTLTLHGNASMTSRQRKKQFRFFLGFSCVCNGDDAERLCAKKTAVENNGLIIAIGNFR